MLSDAVQDINSTPLKNKMLDQEEFIREAYSG